MTTERQRRANRANARKSTGPRSRAGRARSARNATRHGLTTSPDWQDVRSWYRIILEDPSAEPDPLDPDPRHRAVLRLAEAEAWRDRSVRAEEAHLADMASRRLRKGRRSLEDLGKLDLDDPETLELLIANERDPVMRQGIRILLQSCPNRPAALRRTAMQLRRYRRRAEARRRKALLAWIDVQFGTG